MTRLTEQVSMENPVFQAFAFWAAILTLKMVLMSLLTGYYRHKNGAFVNREDSDVKFEPNRRDPDVERVRRAHRNDLENIPILLIVEFFFVLSNPNAFVAANMIKIAAVARILHTFGYAIIPIHRVRGLGFLISMSITMYMAIYSLLYFR